MRLAAGLAGAAAAGSDELDAHSDASEDSPSAVHTTFPDDASRPGRVRTCNINRIRFAR